MNAPIPLCEPGFDGRRLTERCLPDMDGRQRPRRCIDDSLPCVPDGSIAYKKMAVPVYWPTNLPWWDIRGHGAIHQEVGIPTWGVEPANAVRPRSCFCSRPETDANATIQIPGSPSSYSCGNAALVLFWFNDGSGVTKGYGRVALDLYPIVQSFTAGVVFANSGCSYTVPSVPPNEWPPCPLDVTWNEGDSAWKQSPIYVNTPSPPVLDFGFTEVEMTMNGEYTAAQLDGFGPLQLMNRIVSHNITHSMGGGDAGVTSGPVKWGSIACRPGPEPQGQNRTNSTVGTETIRYGREFSGAGARVGTHWEVPMLFRISQSDTGPCQQNSGQQESCTCGLGSGVDQFTAQISYGFQF